MPKLPVVSGKKVVKVLTKIGFFMDHQTGSHIIMRKEGEKSLTISVPKHEEMKTGTLRTLIKQTGLTVDEFLKRL
ncbi:MAG: type II toxin-antitoxin system HicA family toxin [Candidatus Thermoplasmatota archaeon]|nr:type II toxin-antitoxin system HicA family toxin [Candidatus Thermoplasmatota archaeon]